jgi:hypothetical protein
MHATDDSLTASSKLQVAVQPEAVMPAWRGKQLGTFLTACSSCVAIGSPKDHYFATPASCDACSVAPGSVSV